MCTDNHESGSLRIDVEFTMREYAVLRAIAEANQLEVHQLIEMLAKDYIYFEGPSITKYFSEVEQILSFEVVK